MKNILETNIRSLKGIHPMDVSVGPSRRILRFDGANDGPITYFNLESHCLKIAQRMWRVYCPWYKRLFIRMSSYVERVRNSYEHNGNH